jgi:prophage regulatory protein
MLKKEQSNHYNHPTVDPLIKLHDIIGNRKLGIYGMIPMSRSSFYEKIKKGVFPSPLRIGNGVGSYWRLSIIREIIDKAEGDHV